MKTIRIILWIITFLIFVSGLLYFCTGSLEMFPTAEQQEKVRIISVIMMVISAVLGVVLFSTREK